jgi:hypothetical protein
MNESSEASYDFSFYAPQVQENTDTLEGIEERAVELDLVGFIKWDIGATHYGHVKGAEEDIQLFFDELQEKVAEIAVDLDDFQMEQKEREHTYEQFNTLYTYPLDMDTDLSPEEREKFSMD